MVGVDSSGVVAHPDMGRGVAQHLWALVEAGWLGIVQKAPAKASDEEAAPFAVDPDRAHRSSVVHILEINVFIKQQFIHASFLQTPATFFQRTWIVTSKRWVHIASVICIKKSMN